MDRCQSNRTKHERQIEGNIKLEGKIDLWKDRYMERQIEGNIERWKQISVDEKIDIWKDR